MSLHPSLVLAAVATLAVAGCRQAAEDESRGACEPRRFEGSRFTICRYDSRKDRIELAVDDGQAPLRSFDRLASRLGPRARTLRFAMNAGMFDESGRAIGLYVEQGRERHRLSRASGGGNFGMKPNGVFAVGEDGRVEIATTEDWADRPRRPAWASQSGPMLVIGGKLHPRIQPDGPSINIRNGVGVDGPGTAWFVISDDPVSFGRFARFFRDELGCANALYLDGAVSSLWDPRAKRRDVRAQLGPMVLVFDRR